MSFPPLRIQKFKVCDTWLVLTVRFISFFQRCSWLPHRIYTSLGSLPFPTALRAAGTAFDALFLVLYSAHSHTTGSQGLFWQIISLDIPCLLPLLPVMGHGHCCCPPSTSLQLSVNGFVKKVNICLSTFHSVHNQFELLIKNIFRNCQRKREKKKKSSFPVPGLVRNSPGDRC